MKTTSRERICLRVAAKIKHSMFAGDFVLRLLDDVDELERRCDSLRRTNCKFLLQANGITDTEG